MTRLQSVGRPSASLGRRELLAGAAGLVLGGCGPGKPLTASRTPRLDMARLAKGVDAAAARAAPGVLGFGLMNLESGEFWVRLGDRSFPMAGVMTLPLGAAVLAEVDAGRLNLAETLAIAGKALSPPWSPIADAWPGRGAYTAGELLAAAVSDGDNTAADVLMKRIGGPGAVNAWLEGRTVAEVRVDRYARQVATDMNAMASFRPAWKGAAAFEAAAATVAPARRRAALLAYMADPRDSATPRGMLGFLRRLDQGELISQSATRRLETLMLAATHGAARLKAGLPRDASFARASATSDVVGGLCAADNDVGVFTLKDKRSYALAAFLAGSTASEPDRAALFADLGRLAARSVG